MKKISFYLVIICTIFFTIAFFYYNIFDNKEDEYKELTYKTLPLEVKLKFDEVYNLTPSFTIDKNQDTVFNMPPNEECYSIEKTCNCKIDYKHKFLFSNLLFPQKFSISSCQKKFEIPYFILQRIFVIKNDSLYYPYAPNGVLTLGEPLSNNIDIKNIKFHAIKSR
jgi:hypothetical protein